MTSDRGQRFTPQTRDNALTRSRGRAHAIVGFTLFHTVGDREQAANQINTELTALHRDIYDAMGVDPNAFDPNQILKDPLNAGARMAAARAKMEKSPFYPFWKNAVSPILDEWEKFRGSQGGVKEYLYLTNWDDYQKWFDRMSDLRKAFISNGVHPSTPTPIDLSKNPIAEAADAAKKVGEGALALGKIAIYGGLALGGIYILSTIANGEGR